MNFVPFPIYNIRFLFVLFKEVFRVRNVKRDNDAPPLPPKSPRSPKVKEETLPPPLPARHYKVSNKGQYQAPCLHLLRERILQTNRLLV